MAYNGLAKSKPLLTGRELKVMVYGTCRKTLSIVGCKLQSYDNRLHEWSAHLTLLS